MQLPSLDSNVPRGGSTAGDTVQAQRAQRFLLFFFFFLASSGPGIHFLEQAGLKFITVLSPARL